MSLGSSLRTRLTMSAVVGAAIVLAVLVTTFNLVLDARLRADGDNVLRERAATVLRGLGTVDGHLSVLEAPDQGAADTRTWIFVGARALEQPPGADRRDQQAAVSLARAGAGFTDVNATDTRMETVPVTQGARRLGTVVIAASLGPYRSTARAALVGSVLLGVMTLLAVVALSRWLVGRALRPVARMTSEAAGWGEHDLSRRFFTGEPHDELTGLAAVFDHLLTRLRQSLMRERNLTAEISHELRTPLAKISAEAELAGSRDLSAAEHRATLALISRHAEELRRVLETLLAAARAAVPGASAASDAGEVARRASEPLREPLAAQGKSLEIVCSSPVVLAAPADLVERIIAPLLENAARFASRRITVEIAATAGTARIEIRDDGPGIDASERERIFEPGFRGSGPDLSAHRGSGLGLALVRRLARTVGGDVDAQASKDGGRFSVRLPSG
jgi:signal transduction histidine kinase